MRTTPRPTDPETQTQQSQSLLLFFLYTVVQISDRDTQDTCIWIHVQRRPYCNVAVTIAIFPDIVLTIHAGCSLLCAIIFP